MAEREGQQLGNYRLLKLLGQGGFAEMYLGEHIHLGTQAAIKLFSTRVVEDEIALFKQEARTLAHLVHPNIVRVLDFGVEAETNQSYLVMDYASGGTLRKLHPRGTRLPLPTVVAYVKQVAAALQYAHDEKVIHCNVKPENMLLGRNGKVLLSNFDLVVISRSQRISQGNLADTSSIPSYMAPEMFQGEPQTASDQYSLGVVVYEWLFGTVPSPEDNALQRSYQQVHPPIPSLHSHDTTIPSAVERVVLKALAKMPEERFSSVRAFATVLESAIIIGPAPEESETVTPRGISRRAVLLSASGVLGVGLVGAGIWLLVRTPASTISSQHSSTPQPQGTLYVTYRGHTNHVVAVAWSPNGKRIASASEDKTVQVWDAANGGNVFIYRGHTNYAVAVAWSPDGKRIASGSIDVQVWDVANGSNVLTYRGHTNYVVAVAWSPDGKRIASASDDKTVQVWDAANGGNAFIYRYRGSNYALALAWSPDGKRIAAGGGGVQVWDVANGGNALIYRGHTNYVDAVVWSPDGKRIASGSADRTVQVWDAATGGNAFIYRGHSNTVGAIAWSPDSKRIASGSWDQTVQVWQA